MRERDVESYLRSRIHDTGGKAYKWTSPGSVGVPDRIVIYPPGRVYLVELKAPGQKPRPLQIYRIRELEQLGCDVRVIDSKEAVNDFIREVMPNEI